MKDFIHSINDKNDPIPTRRNSRVETINSKIIIVVMKISGALIIANRFSSLQFDLV
jgi:hypothetical protein